MVLLQVEKILKRIRGKKYRNKRREIRSKSEGQKERRKFSKCSETGGENRREKKKKKTKMKQNKK